ncbi:MAG: aminotransferase class V-fold PLP-dependent enzyme [Clostridia bacterium]|nr:aminotransferase class V-fold PLP-dependent enzyme [Clostridia bacterium]
MGIAEIEHRERLLRRRAVAILAGMRRVQVYLPHADEGSIVLFSVHGRSAAEVGEHLDRRGIAVRTGLHCAPGAHRLLGTPEGGAVRASFGMFNTEADVIALCRAVKELL